MRRREFLVGISSTAAWPVVAQAQKAVLVIGFLNSTSPGPNLLLAFRQGLKETGYIEHQNVVIEHRWAEGHYDRLPALAADLVRGQVAVIVATGSAPSALAAKAATTTIPIVFVAGDPLRLGLVASLSRPTGNVTGVSPLGIELEGKKLEILSEVLPRSSVIGVLVNPSNPQAERQMQDIQSTARTLGRQIFVVNASSERDIDAGFATLEQQRIGALLVGSDVFLNSLSHLLVVLAARYSIATIYDRTFAAAGGLIYYGTNILDSYRIAGVYTGRILKGEKPADLPVQQSTKVELIINLKIAKSLGITVPLPLLARADEVIE